MTLAASRVRLEHDMFLRARERTPPTHERRFLGRGLRTIGTGVQPVNGFLRPAEMRLGTAYRIPSEKSHVSQPRSPSTSKRRMRQDR